MKSQNSIWVIVVMGLVGMVAFSGLGFWNVKHPLLQVRPYLQKEHKVTVEKTNLKRDKRGRLDAVEIVVTEPKELGEDAMRRIGCDAFAWLCDKDDRNDILRVVVLSPSGQSVTVNRVEAETFRSMRSKATIDSLRRVLYQYKGASVYDIAPLQTDADGTDLLVQIQVPSGRLDDPKPPAEVARRVRGATRDVDWIEVQVLDKDLEERVRIRFNRRNVPTRVPLGG